MNNTLIINGQHQVVKLQDLAPGQSFQFCLGATPGATITSEQLSAYAAQNTRGFVVGQSASGVMHLTVMSPAPIVQSTAGTTSVVKTTLETAVFAAKPV